MRKLPFGIYKVTIVERSAFSSNIPGLALVLEPF